jgi:hypothetical protein
MTIYLTDNFDIGMIANRKQMAIIKPASVDFVSDYLEENSFVEAIADEGTAALVSKLLNMQLTAIDIDIKFNPATDTVIVARQTDDGIKFWKVF